MYKIDHAHGKRKERRTLNCVYRAELRRGGCLFFLGSPNPQMTIDNVISYLPVVARDTTWLKKQLEHRQHVPLVHHPQCLLLVGLL